MVLLLPEDVLEDAFAFADVPTLRALKGVSKACRLVLCLQLSVLRFVRRSPRGAWCDTFDTTEKQPNCQHGAPEHGAVEVTRFEM